MSPNSSIKLLDYNIFNGKKEFFERGFTGVINTLNPHSFCIARKNPLFKEALLSSEILLPDGIGIVWAALLLNKNRITKIAGSDIHLLLLSNLNNRGGRAFYLGSTNDTLIKIRKRLSLEYPYIEMGLYSPPFNDGFSEEEIKIMINAVNEFSPDILFVGMTAPKQEKWVYQNKEDLNARVICSIGAVFDFFAGTKKRPGKIWIKLGLEWLPRLLSEPRRLWRRTVISTPLFIWFILKEKLKGLIELY